MKISKHNCKYEKLVKYVRDKCSQGDLLEHSIIENVLGTKYKKNCGCINGSYIHLIGKANDVLTKEHKRLMSIKKFGYRVAYDIDYINMANVFYNTGKKKMEKAKFIIDNTNSNGFNANEYNTYRKSEKAINDVLGMYSKYNKI